MFLRSVRFSKKPSGLKGFIYRTILWGAAVGILWSGQRVHARLRLSAAKADRPYQTTVTHAGSFAHRHLYDILTAAGSGAEEAGVIAGALTGMVDVRRLSPEDRYNIVYSTSGRFMHLTLIRGLRRYVVAAGPSGRVRASTHEIALITTRRKAAGAIAGSLWHAMQAEGVPADVILQFADIFQWTVDFLTEVRKGDRFAVAWTERKTADGRPWGRVIRAASYDGPVPGKRLAIRFQGKYFDEKGKSLTRMFLKAPLNFSRISSGFSTKRRHPILRIARPHHGIDYAAAPGTPVSSVADGVVIHAHSERSFGNVVKIRHKSGYVTLYAHLSRFAPDIRAGRRVRQGEVIGHVGATGLATGPHLHFQIEKGARWVDFLKLDLPFAYSVPTPWRYVFALERDKGLANLSLNN